MIKIDLASQELESELNVHGMVPGSLPVVFRYIVIILLRTKLAAMFALHPHLPTSNQRGGASSYHRALPSTACNNSYIHACTRVSFGSGRRINHEPALTIEYLTP